MNTRITYQIQPFDLGGHRFQIKLSIPNPQAKQRVSLPAWIPGSYMLRDFARHIEQIQAYTQDQIALTIQKIDTHTWEIDTQAESLITLCYTVYAWDTSIRSAYLDEKRGFFNGSSVFLQVHGREHEAYWVHILPPHKRKWKVYTTLPEAKNHPHTAKRHQFGMYEAPNYDALIDHPVEMGKPLFGRFKAHGTWHEMVFSGELPNFDLKRVLKDCKKICETQIEFFDPLHKKAAFLDSSDRYLFITFVTGKDYGGLEHRSSTALITARQDLPTKGSQMNDAYCQFLGLVSHEYFHTWHVKRIKPQAFVPYQLYRENFTSLLWIFEGFTSYYDDLMLFRSGLISLERYYELMSKNITYSLTTAGRLKQSLAQSSFDAWSKYYKQDENAPNSIISYYTKGAVVAWLLDLYIRQHSPYSLDDVMRYLWQHYGVSFYSQAAQAKGLREHEFVTVVKQATGVDIQTFVQQYVYATKELPIDELLEAESLSLKWEASQTTPYLGIRCQKDRITHVLEGSPAHIAGLSAGDTIVAIDHLKFEDLATSLQRYQAKDQISIHIFRRDELRKFKVKLAAPLKDKCRLSLA